MDRAVEFAAVLGADKVDQALRLAATAGRFDEAIQTDNGAEFQSSFHYHVLDKGIAHTYIKPASPHLNGRWNARTASTAEFYQLLEGMVVDDTGVFDAKLQEWEDYYNYHRPHGRPPTGASSRRPGPSVNVHLVRLPEPEP